jgi:hypothetical protein
MFGKISIPSPDQLLKGPEYMRWRDKEENKAIKKTLSKLKHEYIGTNRVQINFFHSPACALENILHAFRSKGWKIDQFTNRKGKKEYYYFSSQELPDLEDDIKNGWE